MILETLINIKLTAKQVWSNEETLYSETFE